MINYSIFQWLMFFYVYSFAGWIWESGYVSVLKKRWVNRGFLHLPMLPLYGSGAVLVLFITLPVRSSVSLTYLIGALGATILELAVGLGMEALYKIKYWDYSKEKFNYKGIICLKSTLFWGVLTVVLVKYVHRWVEIVVFAFPSLVFYVVELVISLVFVYDIIVSNREAIQLARILTAIETAREEVQEKIQKLEEELEEQKIILEGRWEEQRTILGEKLEEQRTILEEKLEEQKTILEENLESMGAGVENIKSNAMNSMTRAKERLGESLEANLSQVREFAVEMSDSAELRLDDMYEKAEERSRQLKQQIDQHHQAYEEKREELMSRGQLLAKGMLMRNPTAHSERYAETFYDLKNRTLQWMKDKKQGARNKKQDKGKTS
ncbi:MAG: hypothetical protein PUB22_03740 [Clostridiales bacterium]|nr:hypothetical protein [Clostridiales bacterium]